MHDTLFVTIFSRYLIASDLMTFFDFVAIRQYCDKKCVMHLGTGGKIPNSPRRFQVILPRKVCRRDSSSDGKYYARLRGAGSEGITTEITPLHSVPTMEEVITASKEKINAV
jgi:hypothetical protein